MERGGAHRLTEPMVHSCGFESFYATGYAMHAKHCNGTRPATEGRIAAREREQQSRAVAVRVQRKPRATSGRARRPHPEPAPAGVGAIAAAATDKAMEITIAGLRARRAQIDTALAALEALA